MSAYSFNCGNFNTIFHDGISSANLCQDAPTCKQSQKCHNSYVNKRNSFFNKLSPNACNYYADVQNYVYSTSAPQQEKDVMLQCLSDLQHKNDRVEDWGTVSKPCSVLYDTHYTQIVE